MRISGDDDAKERARLSGQAEQGFILESREGIAGLSFANLESVEVINKTVIFRLTDGTVYEAVAALADFEEMLLSRPDFFKTHRSYIVNLGCVRKISGSCVETESGCKIPLSRQRRSQARNAYIQFVRRTEESGTASGGGKTESSEKPERSEGPWNILFVDDEPDERVLWTDVLRQHGCMVRQAADCGEVFRLLEEAVYDCILLDVMIPGENGFSICEKIRGMVNTPVIFLSSLTEADKQLKGFEAGGIDYITKNTPAELFWAKVETRIRLSESGRTQFCYGALLLDLAGRRALMEEKELPLTPAEFDLLQRLSEQAGHIFTPEELFGIVWGGMPWDGGQLVQTHMSRLRRKLEKAYDGHCFIETVWGQGYRFVPEKE